jgi:hypothetical protein
MEKAAFLAEQQLRSLDRLRKLQSLRGFYLAGGTAVAYHLHHRVSRDLDIFGKPGAADLTLVQLEIAENFGNVEVIAATDVAIHLNADGLIIDLVSYRYQPLEEPRPGPAGFPVAGLLDLATMKLATIARRGLKRDFWDLYEILNKSDITLANALDAYLRRFGKLESDLYHVIRSLTYFDDAEKESINPNGLTQRAWQDIKLYFQSIAPDYLGRIIPA